MDETTKNESSKLDSAEKLKQNSQQVEKTDREREEIDQKLEERKQAEEVKPRSFSWRGSCYFRP